MGKAEANIENYLKKKAKENNCLCYKFISAGTNGVPDRIIIGIDINGKKHTDFIETKAPKEKPRLLQEIIHKEMREHGASVFVLSTKEQIDEYFKKFYKK